VVKTEIKLGLPFAAPEMICLRGTYMCQPLSFQIGSSSCKMSALWRSIIYLGQQICHQADIKKGNSLFEGHKVIVV